MNVAKSVRLNKEKYPERYCRIPNCLWRVTEEMPCPRHGAPGVICVVCGMPITPEMQSFVVLGGRVHEKPCRETWSLERADDLASDYDEYIYGDEPS